MSRHLFPDPAQAGVFHVPAASMAGLETATRAAGRDFLRVEADASAGLAAVLGQLGRALAFPEWYGANLDALHDCLSDPDWHPDVGLVLAISGLAPLAKSAPEDFSGLAEVVRSATEIRRDLGSPLWVLLDTPAADVPPLPGP